MTRRKLEKVDFCPLESARKSTKISTLNDHISKTKKVRKLSLGYLEVLESTAKWYSKSLASALYLEIFGFQVLNFAPYGAIFNVKMDPAVFRVKKQC